MDTSGLEMVVYHLTSRLTYILSTNLHPVLSCGLIPFFAPFWSLVSNSSTVHIGILERKAYPVARSILDDATEAINAYMDIPYTIKFDAEVTK